MLEVSTAAYSGVLNKEQLLLNAIPTVSLVSASIKENFTTDGAVSRMEKKGNSKN